MFHFRVGDQVAGLFQRFVIVTDDGHILVAEKGAVAGGAVADATAKKFRFTGHGACAAHRAGGQDERFGVVDACSGNDAFGIAGYIHTDDFVGQEFSAE